MEKDFLDELFFVFSKSGGPGGQNVNKVNTKVMLNFHVNDSQLLTEEEKVLIHEKLTNRINSDGVLQITSQAERTQLANKEKCIEKFYELITQALKIQKVRKETKPSKRAIQKRLQDKKKLAEKKQNRKKPE